MSPTSVPPKAECNAGESWWVRVPSFQKRVFCLHIAPSLHVIFLSFLDMVLYLSNGPNLYCIRERTWLKWSSFFFVSPIVPEGLVLMDMKWASDWKEAVAKAEATECRTRSSGRQSSSSNKKGIRRPGSACTATVYYVASKIWFKIQNPKSEIQNPKSEIQNPKSKIQNPKSKIQNLHKKKCYILLQNPKSKIQNPESKIQNPKYKIQNPKSKIPNPKFGALGASHKELLHNDPKSKIQNPKSPKSAKSGRKSLDFGLGNFGFWIPDFGFWIPDFGFWGGPGDVPLGNSVTVPGGQRLESPLVRQLYLIGLGEERKRGKGGERRRELKAALWSQNHTYGQYMSVVLLQLGVTKGITNCIWYSWGKQENWAIETREGGRENGGQPFPQLYQILLVLVTFPMCFFVGCLPPPRETCPGRRPQAPACFNPAMHKASDAGHIGPHGMRRCLSFSYRETRRSRRPPPGGKKPALFWGVLDVHKTSQIPSKMALGRGRFGARGGSPKTLTTSRKLIF